MIVVKRERIVINLVVLIVVILSLLLISGCGGTSTSTLSYNFKQGVSEVNVKLMENAPPKQIYPFSKFKLIVDLDNQAAYGVTNGKVNIIGLDSKYFVLDSISRDFNTLQGRSLQNPLGEQKFLTFDGDAKGLFQNAQQYTGNYYLNVDYDSVFEFTDTMCLNPSVYDIYDSGCKEQNRKSYSGQGAPVAITEVEEMIYPYETGTSDLEFRMRLSNRGRGRINTVTFQEAKLGGAVMDCNFVENYEAIGQNAETKKTLVFKSGVQETMVICRTHVPQSKSYTTTVYARFGYQYTLEQRYALRLVK